MSVVDEMGNVTVAGTYSGTVDFDPGVGVETLSAEGGRDIYVAKYTGGGALLWVKSLGGAGAEEVRGLAQDGAGQLYLVGSFSKKYGDDSLQSALHMLKELPESMPVHGLGVGEPEDILLGAEHGVDTFDCVVPTRNGRTGGLYTKAGKIQIPNAEYREDTQSLDPGCECPVCLHHDRRYVHHLFRTHEMLGPILASMHNLYFLTHLTSQIREAILDDRFTQFRDTFLSVYKMR